MSWDDYTKAILRLDLPNGEVEVAPGAFGRSEGTFPGDGRPFHIITAHNPAGNMSSAGDNASAQSRLAARAAESALEYYAAAGGDRAWEHVEPGLAVVGLDREQACAFGREFDQDAIFEWSPTGLAVLSCTDARVHYTGWVSSPVEDSSGSGFSELPVSGTTRTIVPPFEPPTTTELARPKQDIETARIRVDGVAKLERTKLDRAAGDEEYFRELRRRTGFLFDLRDDDSKEPDIDVFGTGSMIKVCQTDHPDRLIVDIAYELPAVLESLWPDDETATFASGAWDAGDIAYTLGGAFDALYIDGVEWSGESLLPSHSAVALPMIGEAPPGCLIATLQSEWDDGGSFSPGNEAGNTELLRIGPIFVERGDEWASVLAATTQEEALREFEDSLPDQEGLEKTLFVEPQRPPSPSKN